MEQFDQTRNGSSNRIRSHQCIDGVYQFHAEDDSNIRWSALKNNPMSGITFPRLIRLIFLKEKERLHETINRKQNSRTSSSTSCRGIDWWIYPHRITALLLISMLNCALEVIEFLYMHTILKRILQAAKEDQQVRRSGKPSRKNRTFLKAWKISLLMTESILHSF